MSRTSFSLKPFMSFNTPAPVKISVTLGIFLNVNLDKIAPERQSLQAGISAVIKAVNGGLTYWALTHPGPQPDFHRRESFVIEL